MKLNYTVLLKIGLDNHQNVILKSYFSSQAGQTEYKQTSHNKKNLWQRAKATQNHMYAGPAPFSLFTLCEPTQTRTETKIKFIMLKKTPKMHTNDKAAEASCPSNSYEVIYLYECLSVDLSSFKFLGS